MRSKIYNDNEVFIELHIEFCLKKVNINDPSYALIPPVCPRQMSVILTMLKESSS